MGKRKDGSGDGGDVSSHKKHKKSKHKKSRIRGDESRVAEAQPGVRPLTLKIKLGGKPITNTAVGSEEEELSGEEDVADNSLHGLEEAWPGNDHSFTECIADQEGGGSDGDEEAWLVAMEKGQLDETGYLPRKLGTGLTARQRAMMGSTDGQLMELPLSKATKEMTEEMILKKTEKNRKRRLAAHRRKERRKAETVRKLLEKQSKKKQEDKPAVEEMPNPMYLHYVRSRHGASLSIPYGVDFPLPSQQTGHSRPAVQLCTVEGCHNPRRYCDSTTQLPLCSLQCYKTLHQNLTLHTPLAVSTQSISS